MKEYKVLIKHNPTGATVRNYIENSFDSKNEIISNFMRFETEPIENFSITIKSTPLGSFQKKKEGFSKYIQNECNNPEVRRYCPQGSGFISAMVQSNLARK